MDPEEEHMLECLLKHSLPQLEQVCEGLHRLVLPSFSPEFASKIISKVHFLFTNEPSMLTLKRPLTIVGDLHGHLIDLLRILQNEGSPSIENKYLFLGDLVDRGEFSVETVLLIFLLKIKYPEYIYIIRGNHEFSQMCHQCGFFAEVIECFPNTDVFDEFMKCFSMLPISANIEDKYLCVHGGIGPNVFTLGQLQNIQRPISEFTSELVTSLLWSDPSEKVVQFQASLRGTGFMFGVNPLKDFLEATKKLVLIRGHECVQSGVQKLFDGKLITVFSASNYCGISKNDGGILKLTTKNSNDFEIKTYSPLNYLKRRSVLFHTSSSALNNLCARSNGGSGLMQVVSSNPFTDSNDKQKFTNKKKNQMKKKINTSKSVTAAPKSNFSNAHNNNKPADDAKSILPIIPNLSTNLSNSSNLYCKKNADNESSCFSSEKSRRASTPQQHLVAHHIQQQQQQQQHHQNITHLNSYLKSQTSNIDAKNESIYDSKNSDFGDNYNENGFEGGAYDIGEKFEGGGKKKKDWKSGSPAVNKDGGKKTREIFKSNSAKYFQKLPKIKGKKQTDIIRTVPE